MHLGGAWPLKPASVVTIAVLGRKAGPAEGRPQSGVLTVRACPGAFPKTRPHGLLPPILTLDMCYFYMFPIISLSQNCLSLNTGFMEHCEQRGHQAATKERGFEDRTYLAPQPQHHTDLGSGERRRNDAWISKPNDSEM